MFANTHVYVLTLESRPDRKAEFLRRWNLVDRADVFASFVMHDGVPKDRILFPKSWTAAHRGHYACTRTHMALMERAYAAGADHAILFEDDAAVPPDFVAQLEWLQRVLPTDWMGCWFGYTNVKQERPATVCPGLIRLNGATRCSAYMLNRRGMERVFDHLTVNWNKIIDWNCAALHEIEPHFYAPDPCMCGTYESFSDSEQTLTGATGYFEGKRH